MKLSNNVILAFGLVAVIILCVVGFQHNKSVNRDAAVQASKASVSSSKAMSKKNSQEASSTSTTSKSSASSSSNGLSVSSSSKKTPDTTLEAGTYVVGKNIQSGTYMMNANNGKFKISLTSKSTNSGSNEIEVTSGSNVLVTLTDDMKVKVTQEEGKKGISHVEFKGQ